MRPSRKRVWVLSPSRVRISPSPPGPNPQPPSLEGKGERPNGPSDCDSPLPSGGEGGGGRPEEGSRLERCWSGRSGTTGNRVTRKGSWVQIPPSPPAKTPLPRTRGGVFLGARSDSLGHGWRLYPGLHPAYPHRNGSRRGRRRPPQHPVLLAPRSLCSWRRVIQFGSPGGGPSRVEEVARDLVARHRREQQWRLDATAIERERTTTSEAAAGLQVDRRGWVPADLDRLDRQLLAHR